MDFYYASRFESNDGITYVLQIIRYNGNVKIFDICFCRLQTEQKFGAVTEFKHAVFVKFSEIEFFGSDFGGVDDSSIKIVVERTSHTLNYTDKTRTAGVHDPRLFQDGKQFGSAH